MPAPPENTLSTILLSRLGSLPGFGAAKSQFEIRTHQSPTGPVIEIHGSPALHTKLYGRGPTRNNGPGDLRAQITRWLQRKDIQPSGGQTLQSLA